MKKLLALVAILSFVGVASAATLTWEKADGIVTQTVSSTTLEYEKYHIFFNADAAEGFNAIDLRVLGDQNIGVLMPGGAPRLYAMSGTDPNTWETVPVVTHGLSGVDVGEITLYALGKSAVAGPNPGSLAFRYVSDLWLAFAVPADSTVIQPPVFTTFAPQFATIYLLPGTSAEVTLMGAAGMDEGGGLSGAQTIGSFVIPEPATLGLLAMGAIGLLRRKLA